MKNYKFWLTCLIGLACGEVFSQSTFATNNGAGGNFLGFNNVGSFPLPIRNDGNTQINISSSLNNKFRITEQATWNGLNGLSRTNVQRTTMGLQGQTGFAYSMLHLWDDAGCTPLNIQRPWMNVGMSLTSNWDFMYSGLLERPVTGVPDVLTDVVIAWGCQSGVNNSDNFRFLFITPTNGSTPAGSEQGLEIMCIAPIGNVGIGDLSSMPNGIGGATSIYGQPRARLDVQFRNAIPANTDNTAVNILNNATDPVSPIPPTKIAIDATSRANGMVNHAIGGRFRAERGVKTSGVYATALGSGNGTTVGVEAIVEDADGELQHYGVIGRARTAIENIGVFGR